MMNRDELKKHIVEDADYYLAKLGFYRKKRFNNYVIKSGEVPKGVYYDHWDNDFFTIEKREVTPQEIELFLLAKKTHSITVLKNCGVIATTVFISLMILGFFIGR